MAKETLIEDLTDARAVLSEFLGDVRPRIGIILGSGLNYFADTLLERRTIAYADVPHMGVSTAPDHRAQFVLGRIPLEHSPEAGSWVLCMQGRLHGYEGFTAQQVAFPVWLMHELGVEILITTNAAGAINPTFSVGDFCVMTDQINFTGRNPLCGIQPNQMAERWVPMKDAFDAELISYACQVARENKITLRKGVFLGLLGPSFETPAEIRMFALWGADTVAMSACDEVIAARHSSMRVLGISLCSNMACGIEDSNPSGEEIGEVASRRETEFSALLAGVVTKIDS